MCIWVDGFRANKYYIYVFIICYTARVCADVFDVMWWQCDIYVCCV